MPRGALFLCILVLLSITITPAKAASCKRTLEFPNWQCNGLLGWLLCNVDALLSNLLFLCGNNPLELTIRVTSGNFLLSLSSTNLYALTITTTGNGNVILNLNANLNVVTNLVVDGLGVLVVPVGKLVTVVGTLIVQPGATLQVAGNVTVQGLAQVFGTLQLNGTRTPGVAQTAWVKSPILGVVLSSTNSNDPAILKGNGGIVGNVVCGANVKLDIGNSPGVVYIDGNLQLSTTTTMIIEVYSATSFDAFAVSRAFTRGSGKITLNFASGYTPNLTDRFLFVSHGSANGYLTVSGNRPDLLVTFGGRSTSVIYGDVVQPSYCTSTCTPIADAEEEW